MVLRSLELMGSPFLVWFHPNWWDLISATVPSQLAYADPSAVLSSFDSYIWYGSWFWLGSILIHEYLYADPIAVLSSFDSCRCMWILILLWLHPDSWIPLYVDPIAVLSSFGSYICMWILILLWLHLDLWIESTCRSYAFLSSFGSCICMWILILFWLHLDSWIFICWSHYCLELFWFVYMHVDLDFALTPSWFMNIYMQIILLFWALFSYLYMFFSSYDSLIHICLRFPILS